MHNARQEQLIVYPGEDEGMKCLAAVAFAARRFAGCKLLDLGLMLESDIPDFNKQLLSALRGGSSQLCSIVAFRLELVDEALDEAPGARRCLASCQKWLLPRMTGLHALSLRARVHAGLGHLTSLRHLVLSLRWHHSLVQLLGGLSPCLESLMLQKKNDYSQCHPPMDLRHLKCLRRLAVHNMFLECELHLPEGCQVYVHNTIIPCIVNRPESCITGRAMRFLMPTEWKDSANDDNELVEVLQAVPDIEDLTVAPQFSHGFEGVLRLRLNAMTLAPVGHLTSLRVFSSWHENQSRGRVEVKLPASLELRCLELAAHSVGLAFEDVAVSMARLTEMKVLCGCFCSTCKDGRKVLQSEVSAHLRAGLCLVLCNIAGDGDEDVECMYIKRSGESDVAPADLLFNRCQCRCCWECLQLDGKLLPAA